MKVIFKRGQASLGAIESLLRRPRSGDTDLRQTRRVLTKLLEGLFVKLSESIPFVLDERFDAPLDGLSILFGRLAESIELRLHLLEAPLDLDNV